MLLELEKLSLFLIVKPELLNNTSNFNLAEMEELMPEENKFKELMKNSIFLKNPGFQLMIDLNVHNIIHLNKLNL
jgi:hypothetical protein